MGNKSAKKAYANYGFGITWHQYLWEFWYFPSNS